MAYCQIWDEGLDFGLPESAARSSKERPLRAKLFCSRAKLKVGDGNVPTSLALDILPSFLPFCTYQDGPPACNMR